ncbi:hypothetical protein [Nocardia rhizosphaerihabitans]|nr:hypothetical protein [Nocardia rhizosphaerihabitans]
MSAPLTALTETGVSIWLDDLSRGRLIEGSVARPVAPAVAGLLARILGR